MIVLGRARRARHDDLVDTVDCLADAIDELNDRTHDALLDAVSMRVRAEADRRETLAKLQRAEWEIVRINAERRTAAEVIYETRQNLGLHQDACEALRHALRKAIDDVTAETARADRAETDALELHDQLLAERRRVADLEELLRQANHQLHAATHPADDSASVGLTAAELAVDVESMLRAAGLQMTPEEFTATPIDELPTELRDLWLMVRGVTLGGEA